MAYFFSCQVIGFSQTSHTFIDHMNSQWDGLRAIAIFSKSIGLFICNSQQSIICKSSAGLFLKRRLPFS